MKKIKSLSLIIGISLAVGCSVVKADIQTERLNHYIERVQALDLRLKAGNTVPEESYQQILNEIITSAKPKNWETAFYKHPKMLTALCGLLLDLSRTMTGLYRDVKVILPPGSIPGAPLPPRGPYKLIQTRPGLVLPANVRSRIREYPHGLWDAQTAENVRAAFDIYFSVEEIFNKVARTSRANYREAAELFKDSKSAAVRADYQTAMSAIIESQPKPAPKVALKPAPKPAPKVALKAAPEDSQLDDAAGDRPRTLLQTAPQCAPPAPVLSPATQRTQGEIEAILGLLTFNLLPGRL